MIDLRQSPQYAKYLETIGWKIEKINRTHIFLKKIPIFGWFIKIQRPQNIFKYDDIKTLERRYNPFQISIEPAGTVNRQWLITNGFKLSQSPSLPTKTLQIDLDKSEDYLLKNLSQKTRYNIHLAKKRQVEIIESKNIEDFTDFWRQNFEKKRFPILSQQKNIIALNYAFGNDSKILIAKKENQIIASLFLLVFDKTMYYMYAASCNEGKKLFAPTLLTWNAIILAKKMGCKIFDFDGIYDERFPIKTWQGFTKFKKGFGGYEIEYPESFVKSKFNLKIFK